MLLIAIKGKSRVPAYRQIADQVARLVETDALAIGEILPPTRTLARQLGVSRYTVCQAYQELWALGYIDSKPGSYSRVRAKASPRTAKEQQPGRILDWPAIVSPTVEAFCTEREASANGSCPEGVIDLGTYHLDPGLFPIGALRRSFLRACTEANAELLNYGDPQGYLPLRQFISAKLRSHSIQADPGEIMITNGALHGLDLVFRLLGGPGVRRSGRKPPENGGAAEGAGKVILEIPAFSCALSLCRLYGMTPVGVPLRAEGMDLRALEEKLREPDIKFLFTIPSFHNPTGITASQANRERVLDLCRERRLPVVEDAFEEEITYFGPVLLPLKSMDRDRIVMSLGTFSKVLFPGLRLGWIVADSEVIGRLKSLRGATDDCGSPLIQAAMSELCRAGHYEKHLALVNKVYARRMKAALDALRRSVPPGRASWTEPSGGFLIWLKLAPTRLTERQIGAHLAKHGVWAAGGSAFFPRDPKNACLRISIARHDEESLREGIRRLGKALEALDCGRPPRLPVPSRSVMPVMTT